jgi:hypothetical protein
VGNLKNTKLYLFGFPPPQYLSQYFLHDCLMESGRSCIHELGASILPISMTSLLELGIFPRVWCLLLFHFKTDRNDMAEILFKVGLNSISQIKPLIEKRIQTLK